MSKGKSEVKFPKPCADVYDPATLPDFKLKFEPAVWKKLVDECPDETKTYYPATFSYQNETVPAMVRLKGKWSYTCGKMQFVISFNEVDKKGRFHGLRKLVLDAPWYDHTVLHERLAFDFLSRYGVPASCANNARLSINGQFYGIYTNVERIDHEYLERNFADEDGDLWEAAADLKTNEETGNSNHVDAFWSAKTVKELKSVVDLEHAVRVWAGSAMLPDRDSYWAGIEANFYMYDHPKRGLLFLPVDTDMSFASPAETTQAFDKKKAAFDPLYYEHPEWGREPAMAIVLSNPNYCRLFVEALKRAHAAYDVKGMQAKLAAWAKQIAPSIRADKRREFSDEQNKAALAYTHKLIAARAAFIGNWLKTEHCPAKYP